MTASATIRPPATAVATTILIVEDTIFWQKQIEQAMLAAGYAAVVANNGMEALGLVEALNPALIISDVEMPGMGGLELMKALRNKPRWQKLPIILLTTGAAKERVIEATRLRAAEYMLKGAFSADQLAERVKKWLNPAKTVASTPAPKKAVSAFPRLLQRSEVLTAITAQASTGKTLANVVVQATEACNPATNNPAGLLEIVKHDPIFAMRILQQANASKRVGTIEDGVRAIGVDKIRAIAQSLSVYPAASNSAQVIWQHSIAVASVMHKIVPRSFEISIGVAYLIGLLHDLPEILLRQAFPGEYEAACDFADQAGRPVRHIMPDIFSVSISDIANDLATLLKLPPLLATPLREYTAATEVIGENSGRSAPIVDRLAQALRFAEYYTNALQLTSTPLDAYAYIAPLSLVECRAAYVATDAINGEDIRSHAICMAAKLADGVPSVSASTTPRLKLWYTRHKSYAEFDPVEEALKCFAYVETHPEPPSKREQFANLDGVVVTAPAIDTFGLLWCLPDRMPQGSGSTRPNVLYILPPSVGANQKSVTGGDVSTLCYPFSLSALDEVLRSFR